MKSQLLLGNLQVKDIDHILVKNPTFILSTAPLLEVLEKITQDLRTRQVYVVDENQRLIGVVRMNSVVEYLFPFDAVLELNTSLYDAYYPKFGAETARDIMISPPVKVTEDTALGEMASLMMKKGVNELPVVDDQECLIGQVNMYEVICAYLDIAKSSTS